MRTRNFRAWNEVIDRGAVARSQKGQKANVESNVGECFQWKATGQIARGSSFSFSDGQIVAGNSGEPPRQKGQSSSPAPSSKAMVDGKENPQNHPAPKRTLFRRSKIPCRWRNCTIPSCSCRHPPVCQIYNSEIGC